MQAAQIPAKFNIPFGGSASVPYIRPIPQASQIGIQDGAASLETGFPPDTFTPSGAGGVGAWGADFNGILFEATSWDRWISAGGAVPWDSAFSAAISGYPAGAVVASATVVGVLWLSLVDNNVTNPDAAGAGWVKIVLAGTSTTGDAKLTLKATADTGWILANDGTIGSAASGATTRANADTVDLYTLMWNNVSNTYAPVSTGRGANAAADFAANKTIGIPKVLGRALGVSGSGSGLTARALGQTLGEELHTMTLAELVAHTHAGLGGSNFISATAGGGSLTAAGTDFTPRATTASTGSSTPFNVMQPTSFWNLQIKL